MSPKAVFPRMGTSRYLRQLCVLCVSAMVTVTALVLADDEGGDKGGDSGFTTVDLSKQDVELAVKVFIDFNRLIAVSEKDIGDIILSRKGNPSSVVKETKGFCVRANYTGSAWLRINSANGKTAFALENENKDSIPLGVAVNDKIGGNSYPAVKPGEPMLIKPQSVEYDCASSDATTELVVSGDFNNIKNKSGRYQTTLNLTFSAG